MGNDEAPPTVAPPLYTRTDPHRDALPPYRKSEEGPPATTIQPLGTGGGEEATAGEPKSQAAAGRTRKKRVCIVGSLVLLAVLIPAVVCAVYYGKKASDGSRGPSVADPSETGIQPDSRGPPVVALADGSNRRMSSYSKRASNHGLWIWQVGTDGRLARKKAADAADGAAWEAEKWATDDSRRFLTAPVLASDGTHGTGGLALALEASTGAILACYANAPYDWERDCAWQSLGGRFTALPTGLDVSFYYPPQVYAVAEDGHLWRRRMEHRSSGDGRWPPRPVWNDWERSNDGGFAGAPSTYHSGSNDGSVYLAAVQRGTYRVLSTNADALFWYGVPWDDHGRPPPCADDAAALGPPKLFSVGRPHVGLLAACGGRLWHRALQEAPAERAWHVLDAPGGAALTHGADAAAQALLGEARGPGDTPHGGPVATPYLVARTTDACYHATALLPGANATGAGAVRGGPWQRLWCPTAAQRGLATAVACDEGLGRCHLFREDADGRLLRAATEPLTRSNGSVTVAPAELEWESLAGWSGQ